MGRSPRLRIVVALIAALVYARRQYRQAQEHTAELLQPNVAMFMEPSASDWHLVDLVVMTPLFFLWLAQIEQKQKIVDQRRQELAEAQPAEEEIEQISEA